MTFVFLGMFVAASAGEVLFNKEEADILLHRPVTARALLWAKIGVLVQVSLWLAAAFNLGGLFAGIFARDGGLAFPRACLLHRPAGAVLHRLRRAGLPALPALVRARAAGRPDDDGASVRGHGGGVRWPDRAADDGRIRREAAAEHKHLVGRLLPPGWFAGLDDALAGSRALASWVLAAWGLVATAAVLWLAFGKLARDYGTGLQTLGEARTVQPKQRARRRWLGRAVTLPPLRWWLGDSVSRAAFLLTAAYLLRDRETKLRVYPALASMLVMPVIVLVQQRSQAGVGSFGIAFAGTFLGIIPVLGLNLMQFSQQWQAADLFRAAPILGPGPLCHGARRAVLCLLTLPVLSLLGAVVWLMWSRTSELVLLLPGAIALPVFALIPSLGGKAVPLSMPSEEAKASNRGIAMIGVMILSAMLSGLATAAWSAGWLKWLLLFESATVAVLYAYLRSRVSKAHWPAME